MGVYFALLIPSFPSKRSEGSTIEVVELSVHKEGEAAIETEQARPRGGEDAQAEANVRRPQVSPSDRSDGFKSSTAPGMIFATVGHSPFFAFSMDRLGSITCW